MIINYSNSSVLQEYVKINLILINNYSMKIIKIKKMKYFFIFVIC